MKKQLLMLIICFGLTFCSFAQTAPAVDEEENIALDDSKKDGEKKSFTPEERAKRQSDKFTEKFSLSPAQQTQVYDILLARARKADEIKGRKETAKEAAKSEWKSTNEESEARLKGVLTPDQLAAYDKWKEGKKAKMKDKKGERSKGKGKEKLH